PDPQQLAAAVLDRLDERVDVPDLGAGQVDRVPRLRDGRRAGQADDRDQPQHPRAAMGPLHWFETFPGSSVPARRRPASVRLRSVSAESRRLTSSRAYGPREAKRTPVCGLSARTFANSRGRAVAVRNDTTHLMSYC